MYLQEIVDNTIEEPLDVHFSLSPESESIQAEGGADIRKDGFYGGKPSVVDEATF